MSKTKGGTEFRFDERVEGERHVNQNLLLWYELMPRLAHCKLRAYFLENEEEPQVFPPPSRVFQTLEHTAPDDVRIVIVTDDPSDRTHLNEIPGVVQLSRRMTEARQGTPGTHSHIGWEGVIEKLILALNAEHQDSIIWMSESPSYLRSLLGEKATNLLNISERELANEYLKLVGKEEITWNSK